MGKIKTRNHLIKFLEDNAPTRTIFRALLNHNENLGGFSRIFSPGSPGWIVEVITKFNNVWHIAVIKDQITDMLYVYIIKNVPWKFWIGDQSKNPLYCGDYPEKYKELMEKEIEDAKTGD